MAYDVIKTIRGRDYRYRVQSERDPVSGKRRNRWTYVGRVDGAGEAPQRREPGAATRRKLLEATERLLERGDPAGITADAIAAEAGVAHGTFYRYFTDRGAAMEAVSRHLRATHGLDVENLRDDVASAAAAAVQLRSWMVQKMRVAQERPGLVRTFTALALVEPRLAAYRNERRESTLLRMREHFRWLAARGFAPIDDPDALAHALFALIDGVYRETVLDGNPLEESHIAAAATIVERAVFARDVSG